MAVATDHSDDAASQDHNERATGLDNDDYSSEEERQGRFHGPDASWRFYTKRERDLASSLDQIENNDLSAHLYNAHNLKRRLYGNAPLEPWHSKQRWMVRDDTGQTPFHPDTSWTAWPLEPTEVPRTSEQWGVAPLHVEDEADTYRKRMRWTPGAQLRECIHADILRQAKERFRERLSADTMMASSLSQGHSLRPTLQPVSDDSSTGPPSSTPLQPNAEMQDESAESSSEGGTQGSLAFHPASPASTMYAVPTADDELAADIARPTVNQIMAKMEDLLQGLHHSRQGHRRTRSQSRLGNVTRRDRSSSRGGPYDENSGSPLRSAERSSGAIHPRYSRKRPELGTRDWSEVLGVAALVGWDQAVVARAAQRCARLFDESMEFRVVPTTVTNPSPDEVAHVEGDAGLSSVEVKAELCEPPRDNAGFCCPHNFCSRHHEPYRQLWRLREHLKRKHKHAADDVDDMVSHVKEARTFQEIGSESIAMAAAQHEPLSSGYSGLRHRPMEDEYLQPVLINIGRSKDKKVRRTPSREHLRKVAAIRQETKDEIEE